MSEYFVPVFEYEIKKREKIGFCFMEYSMTIIILLAR